MTNIICLVYIHFDTRSFRVGRVYMHRSSKTLRGLPNVSSPPLSIIIIIPHRYNRSKVIATHKSVAEGAGPGNKVTHDMHSNASTNKMKYMT